MMGKGQAMQTKEVKVVAECAAGWGRGDTLPEALRNMIEFSRGYINPKKMTLAQFIEEVEKQGVKIRLQEERGGELADVAFTGDKYNHAKILVED